MLQDDLRMSRHSGISYCRVIDRIAPAKAHNTLHLYQSTAGGTGASTFFGFGFGLPPNPIIDPIISFLIIRNQHSFFMVKDRAMRQL